MAFFEKYVPKDRILCVTPTSLKSLRLPSAMSAKRRLLIEKLSSRLRCYDFALIIPRTVYTIVIVGPSSVVDE